MGLFIIMIFSYDYKKISKHRKKTKTQDICERKRRRSRQNHNQIHKNKNRLIDRFLNSNQVIHDHLLMRQVDKKRTKLKSSFCNFRKQFIQMS